MLSQTILEGLGLGALLVLVCTIGIHKGAVGMAHLYDAKVQERCVALGLTTKEKIKQNSLPLNVKSVLVRSQANRILPDPNQLVLLTFTLDHTQSNMVVANDNKENSQCLCDIDSLVSGRHGGSRIFFYCS